MTIPPYPPASPRRRLALPRRAPAARKPIAAPKPAAPALPRDPILDTLVLRAKQLHTAGVSYRVQAEGAQLPPSTLTDLVAGRRAHLTVADARALAGYFQLTLVLGKPVS